MVEGRTVLVVDDSAGYRELLRTILEEDDLDVLEADSGYAALTALAHAAPELILLDVMMPGLDGLETARRIRTLPSGGDIPILFLTGVQDHVLHGDTILAGGDDWLPKSADSTTVRIRVRALLRLGAVQAELRAVHEEITRQRDQLLIARDRQRELAAMVVHDLKNPLAGILLSAAFVAEEELSEPAREAIDDILGAGAEMDRLILDILDLASAHEPELTPVLEPTDLGEIWRDVLLRNAGRLAVAGVGHELDLAPDARTLRADRRLLDRVFSNLLDNAIRFAPPESAVRVLGRRAGGAVEVTISDEGPGIPAAAIDRIFEPGTSNGGSSGRNHGLGLAFCRLAAEAHGGTIAARNLAAGGAAFTVRLPALEDGA